MPTWSIYINRKRPATFSNPPSYVGPGDVVAGAIAWWGLRAYSAAKTGTNAIRLRRDSDNAEQDFATLGNGNLDTGSITSFKGAANLFVTKIYDQTGNGFDAVQATAANQPTFTLNNFGSFPTVNSDGNNLVLNTAASASSQAQPISSSWVANYQGFGQVTGWGGGGSNIEWSTFNAAGQYKITAGAGPVVYSATDASSPGIWHAVQIVLNSPTTDTYVDGTHTALGDAGTAALNVGTVMGYCGTVVGFAACWLGSVNEQGFWPIGFSGAQAAQLNSNQHTYWGF